MSGETLCNDEKAVSHMLPYMFGSLGKTRAVLLHHPLIDNPHVQDQLEELLLKLCIYLKTKMLIHHWDVVCNNNQNWTENWDITKVKVKGKEPMR
jgi:hypothetical protein